jgi:hypothetical protein
LAYWAIAYFGQLLENYVSSPNFLSYFHRKKFCINFDKKWFWLHFGLYFSQTHLVIGVAQWTSHPPHEQADPGSNPARVKGFEENKPVLLCIK